MTKTSRALRLAAVPVAALLLLGACSATYEGEVDPTDPASVAAAIIGYAAHEQFDEACEHSSEDECVRHLREAHARWAEAGLLEQAKSVQADDFGVNSANSRISWGSGPDLAYDGFWSAEYTETEDGQIKVATHALQNYR